MLPHEVGRTHRTNAVNHRPLRPILLWLSTPYDVNPHTLLGTHVLSPDFSGEKWLRVAAKGEPAARNVACASGCVGEHERLDL